MLAIPQIVHFRSIRHIRSLRRRCALASLGLSVAKRDTLCGRYGVADIVCGRYRRFPIAQTPFVRLAVDLP